MPRTNHSNVTEVAHIRTDLDKYHSNFDSIDWSAKVTVKDDVAHAEIQVPKSSHQEPGNSTYLDSRSYNLDNSMEDAGTRNQQRIEELEKQLVSTTKVLNENDAWKRELERKLFLAIEALCAVENATDSHSIARNDDVNKLVNDALDKIRGEK